MFIIGELSSPASFQEICTFNYFEINDEYFLEKNTFPTDLKNNHESFQLKCRGSHVPTITDLLLCLILTYKPNVVIRSVDMELPKSIAEKDLLGFLYSWKYHRIPC